jgi:hypothetical protein
LRLRGLDFDEFLADLCWDWIASFAAVLDVKLNCLADIPKALKVLKRAGVGKPPIKSDELPPRKKRAKRQAA